MMVTMTANAMPNIEGCRLTCVGEVSLEANIINLIERNLYNVGLTVDGVRQDDNSFMAFSMDEGGVDDEGMNGNEDIWSFGIRGAKYQVNAIFKGRELTQSVFIGHPYSSDSNMPKSLSCTFHWPNM